MAGDEDREKKDQAIKDLETVRKEMQERNPEIDMYEEGTTFETLIDKLEEEDND